MQIKRTASCEIAPVSAKLRNKSRKRRAILSAVAEVSVSLPRNDLLPELELIKLPLGQLKLAARKLRAANPAHVREVSSSIAKLGFCDPILIGAENEIVDGEIRYLAAKEMGLSVVPCVRITHLSPSEIRILRLASNRLSKKGEWDIDALKIEFKELIIDEAPIEISGFHQDEIDHILLDDVESASETGPLEPSGGEPITKLGDVVQLGRHTIVCGDATKPETFQQLMRDVDPVRFVLTDPPYNVPIAGHVSGTGHREFVMASGEMTEEQFRAFNQGWIAALKPYLIDGAIVAPFMDWRGYPILHAAARAEGWTQINLVTWIKSNGGMGSLYRSQHELLPLYKTGKAAHVNNINLGRRGRWRSNVWSYPGASSFGTDARRGLKNHPTVKPTAMLEDALLDLSNRGDVILDPFLGSGSTLLAAERTGRTCVGIELDPHYVDLTIERFETVTGRKATRIVAKPSETEDE